MPVVKIPLQTNVLQKPSRGNPGPCILTANLKEWHHISHCYHCKKVAFIAVRRSLAPVGCLPKTVWMGFFHNKFKLTALTPFLQGLPQQFAIARHKEMLVVAPQGRTPFEYVVRKLK
jgi:hypothetical protein